MPDPPSTLRPPSSSPSKHGGTEAIVLFVIVLAAYVAQSQLTQYVQADLGYTQPYFLFYVAHSSFIVIFPLHLFYLTRTTGIPSSRYLSGLRLAITQHLSDSPATPIFPLRGLVRLVLSLTAGVTVTAVLWYVSVAFAPISDVTAIFNTNAFWAYLLSVFLISGRPSRPQWEFHKLFAVLTACVGVFAVVYGSSQPAEHAPESQSKLFLGSLSSTTFGDALALISSISYASYQVLYKRYAVLSPEDDPHQPPSPLPPATGVYRPLLTTDPETSPNDALEPNTLGPRATAIRPPFAFHPNFLTSLIGLTTLVFLWVPIPLMSIFKIGSPFAFPPNWVTWCYISLIASTGVVFNAGFMVLLGIWGPVVVSVGNLLTIALVLASDAILGNGAETITPWTLLGCGMIIGAFTVLAMDMLRR